MSLLTDQLLAFIFDGKPHILFLSMKNWLVSSRRFGDFVDVYKDKIRKKIRTTQNHENLLDLRLELQIAYLLLQEQRLSLIYEPGLSEKGRRPDFAVNYTTSLTFMVEVTRIRVDSEDISEHLMDAIFSKVGQFLPKHSNILIIGVDQLRLIKSDLQALMIRLQQRAEHNENQILSRYGFRDRADFFQQYQCLSEIIVKESGVQADISAIVWINPQARLPLPAKVRTTFYRSQVV